MKKKECGRCATKQAKTMSIEAAGELEASFASQRAAAISVEELLNGVVTDAHPDIVIAVKNSDGKYAVYHLNNLCSSEAENAVRNKGCTHRVTALLSEVLKVSEKQPSKPRKPRTPKETPKDTPKDTPNASPEKPNTKDQPTDKTKKK